MRCILLIYTCLPWVCCVALPCLFVCLILLASFCHPSHLSFKNMYIFLFIAREASLLWPSRANGARHLYIYLCIIIVYTSDPFGARVAPRYALRANIAGRIGIESV